MSAHIGTYLLNGSLKLLLLHSLTGLLMPSVADLLILGTIPLLFFSILLHRLLDSVALLLGYIVALLLSLQTRVVLKIWKHHISGAGTWLIQI